MASCRAALSGNTSSIIATFCSLFTYLSLFICLTMKRMPSVQIVARLRYKMFDIIAPTETL